MSGRLAALRRRLDSMPSPAAERPGLLLPAVARFLDALGELAAREGSRLAWVLKATAPKRRALLRYEQWNIDPASVVSFAALAFGRDALTPAGEGGA